MKSKFEKDFKNSPHSKFCTISIYFYNEPWQSFKLLNSKTGTGVRGVKLLLVHCNNLLLEFTVAQELS